jgi:hypothetical protein
MHKDRRGLKSLSFTSDSDGGRANLRTVAPIVVLAAMLTACSAGLTSLTGTSVPTTPVPSAAPPTAETPPPVETPITPPPAEAPPTPAPGPIDARQVLAPLAISDAPAPGGYRRDEWPHWLDLDGDGCDTREQLLVAVSEVPAQVGRSCKVTGGQWTSAYDGRVFTDPSGLDVDHVVPLGNAYISGGYNWSTDQRARYANDPAVLWAVSASTNRSKGDDPPDQWRPPRPEVWCTYATRWVSIKVTYGLTATTSERDALGQMLDTCGAPPAP